MKISIVLVGKTDDSIIENGLQRYLKRLKKYAKIDLIVIPAIKKNGNITENIQKKTEADKILEKLNPNDFVVLLDEIGSDFTSEKFADFINNKMISGIRNLVFIIGGPYGVDDQIKTKANFILSLSKMTFSHQMIRLFFVEQIYRAFTIINNEPYHHK